MIAELLEFLDHSGSARTLGLGTDRRTAFLVVDSLMQNLPKHSAKSMGYGSDCLFVSQARQQPAKRHVKYASFDLDRRLSSLIQKPPHGAVALRRTRAWGLPCALFVPRTHPHPRRQGLLRLESRCRGAYFGDPLDRRIHPETGRFRHSLHRVPILLE